jgi:DNA-binding PadR family transcriptional regulator
MTDLVEKGYFAGPFEVGQVGEGHGVFVLTEKGVAELLEIKKTEDEMKKRMKERQA